MRLHNFDTYITIWRRWVVQISSLRALTNQIAGKVFLSSITHLFSGPYSIVSIYWGYFEVSRKNIHVNAMLKFQGLFKAHFSIEVSNIGELFEIMRNNPWMRVSSRGGRTIFTVEIVN